MHAATPASDAPPEPRPESLRARKRRVTHERIADAARTLALRDGLDQTTIDAIAAHADIAPRTFFNHFDSKEDAVLGLEEVDLDPDRIAEHVAALAGRPSTEATIALVFRVFGPAFADAALRRTRREVLVRFPQLMRRQMTHMTTTSEALAGAVQTLMAEDPAWGPAATPAGAEMVLGVCMTALRTTVRARAADAPADPATLEREVTALIRDTARRIA